MGRPFKVLQSSFGTHRYYFLRDSLRVVGRGRLLEIASVY